jgi:hypothetical protein
MKTRYYSYKLGSLAKGCMPCINGEKSVLFITGLCARHCYFCPISDKKRNKDVVYINEWPTKKEKDILKEVSLCSSKGAGITGGDPLVKTDRCVKLIRMLKKKFGKKFHIHLYTPLNLVDEKKLEKLYKAGLDEIRFHPDLEDDKEWNKLVLAKRFNWDIGVEIPSIPGKEKETKKLIDFIKGKIDFLNINELEISDTNAQNFVKMGFKPKDRISYGVKGSEELALKLLRYCKGKIKNVHYCTTKLKDRVQLRKRIMLRAKNAKKPYDLIIDDGMLYRGVIYCKQPRKVMKQLMKEYVIPKSLIEFDKKKNRILTASWIVYELRKDLKKKGLIIALVEEYPTYDQLEVEINYL